MFRYSGRQKNKLNFRYTGVFMAPLLSVKWNLIFHLILSETDIKNIERILQSNVTYYPNLNNVFRAFGLTDYDSINVVVIGADPYPNIKATGLPFETKNSVLPASIKAIAKELRLEGFYRHHQYPVISTWAKQGVLLLNASLTISSDPKQKKKDDKIWHVFTKALVRYISSEKKNIVFMLWGNIAKSFLPNIKATGHLLLVSGHPSPQNRNRATTWFGNDHFRTANKYLNINNKKSIKW